MNSTAKVSQTAPVPTRRFDHVTLVLTSLVLLVPVVSFVADISPLDTVTGFLRNLMVAKDALRHANGEFVEYGAPMLIGWMLLAARWRLHVSKRIDRWLQWPAWLAASASIGTTTWLILGEGRIESFQDFFTCLLPLATLLVGLSLFAWRWTRHGRESRDVVIALEVAFTAHALFLVSGFFGDGQIGWWLTLACLLGILPDLISAWARPSGSPSHAPILHPSAP